MIVLVRVCRCNCVFTANLLDFLLVLVMHFFYPVKFDMPATTMQRGFQPATTSISALLLFYYLQSCAAWAVLVMSTNVFLQKSPGIKRSGIEFANFPFDFPHILPSIAAQHGLDVLHSTVPCIREANSQQPCGPATRTN